MLFGYRYLDDLFKENQTCRKWENKIFFTSSPPASVITHSIGSYTTFCNHRSSTPPVGWRWNTLYIIISTFITNVIGACLMLTQNVLPLQNSHYCHAQYPYQVVFVTSEWLLSFYVSFFIMLTSKTNKINT